VKYSFSENITDLSHDLGLQIIILSSDTLTTAVARELSDYKL